MGFPSSAADHAEQRITLNQVVSWEGNPAVFLVKAYSGSCRAVIKKDSVLIVNKARRSLAALSLLFTWGSLRLSG